MIDSLTRAMIKEIKKDLKILADVYTERCRGELLPSWVWLPCLLCLNESFFVRKGAGVAKSLSTGNRLNDPLWAAISLQQMKKNLESLDRSTSSLLYLRPK
jgi:hypothetical protein